LSNETELDKETIEEIILYLVKKKVIKIGHKNDSSFQLSYLKPYYNKKLGKPNLMLIITLHIIFFTVVSLAIFLLYHYVWSSYIFLGISCLIAWIFYSSLFGTPKAVRIVEKYYRYRFFWHYRVIKRYHDQISLGDSRGYVSFQISRKDFREMMKKKEHPEKLPYGVSVYSNKVNCIITVSYQDF